MGLTIHYSIQTPKSPTPAALKKVEAMRQRALDLPFSTVSELMHFKPEMMADKPEGKLKYDDPKLPEDWRWALIQAKGNVSDPVKTPEGWQMSYSVDPIEAILFEAWPGHECEAMNVGLCRYPTYIEVPDRSKRKTYDVTTMDYVYPTKKLKTGLTGWHWASFCKTQYASSLSVDHFLVCHSSVIALLDFVSEMRGVTTTVHDEGKFYEKRDFKALAEEVCDWNKMIAGFLGALQGVMSADSIEAPITKHPQFELLEAAGAKLPYVEAISKLMSELK